jgi:hypothetical protein
MAVLWVPSRSSLRIVMHHLDGHTPQNFTPRLSVLFAFFGPQAAHETNGLSIPVFHQVEGEATGQLQ